MEIYIKPKKKAALLNRHEVLISDIAGVVAKSGEAKKIGELRLLEIKSGGKKSENYLVPVTDIIKKIQAAYPSAIVNNVGEADTWVHCAFRARAEKPLFLWLRVAAVSLILFVGAATAIMSFHTDGQIPKVFERYHEIFYGEPRENPPSIAIPYSIGLALGIIVFYNHFMGRKITDDPTPIEVEIETYEREVTEAMLALMEQRDDA